ncbi:hypothetical protein ABIB94_007049 [Bradyrhizobium sp. JR7.2]|uniref:hypothetical protein n=1 Tax=Bradyrhizobium sp. JR7.2 TaxID=3156375 RepID=UPI0033940367
MTHPIPEMQRLIDRLTEPCEYCGDGKRTGLPGNACENCMNTGLKHPKLLEIMEAVALPSEEHQ